MNTPTLLGIQVGLPRTYGSPNDPNDPPWRTGIFKDVVPGPVKVSLHGLEGDGQDDLKHHGGRDKAVYSYASEHYPAWEAELGMKLPAAAFGENLTTRGLLEAEVCIGDVYRLGSARLEVCQPRRPCSKLVRRFGLKDFADRFTRSGRSGLYFRVLGEGSIQAGDAWLLDDRPAKAWSVAQVNRILQHVAEDPQTARELMAFAPLADEIKDALQKKLAKV